MYLLEILFPLVVGFVIGVVLSVVAIVISIILTGPLIITGVLLLLITSILLYVRFKLRKNMKNGDYVDISGNYETDWPEQGISSQSTGLFGVVLALALTMLGTAVWTITILL